MSQEWYYSVGGDRQGPVSAQDLRKLVDAGTIKAADLVWKDGMADWVAAKSIKGLFPAGTSSAGTPAAERPAPVKTEEAKPSNAFADMDAEDDDRPSKKGRAVARRDEDDDDDDRPRGRKSREEDDDDDDDRPRRRKKGRRLPDDVASKKMTAGLLAILIGGLGIHKFYLGNTTAGILQIVLSFCTLTGGIIGIIEGIIYLTKSDEEFYETYIVGQKGWF